MEFEAKLIINLQNIFSSEFGISFFKLITYMGSFVGIGLLFLIIFLKDKKLGLIYLLISVFSAIINYLIKSLINRPRPYVSYTEIKNYLQAMGSSMPSSHSMIMGIFLIFSVYVITKFINKNTLSKLTKIIVGIITILVLISRMVLGQHYITDIIVGFLCGIFIATMSIWLLYIKNVVKINKKR